MASALLHAGWNLAIKRSGGGGGGVAFLFLFSLVPPLVYAPFAAFAGAFDLSGLGWMAAVFVVGSAAIHVVYFLALQRGYRVGDLSVVYPLARAGGPALATVGAILLFGERPSVMALCGTALVVLGALSLVSRGSARRGTLSGGGQRIGQAQGPGRTFSIVWAPGIAWAALTAVCIAAYTLWDARAVVISGLSPLAFLWWSELARVVLVAPLALRRPAALAEAWRRHRTAALIVGVFSPLAYLMVLVAFTMAPISLVAPMREVSVLFGTLLGAIVLQEGDLRRRLGAAAAMVLGVVLLALA